MMQGAAGAATGGYSVDNSIVLDDGSSQRLNWTPGTAASSDKIHTVSVWFKLGNLGTNRRFINAEVSGGTGAYQLGLNTSDKLIVHPKITSGSEMTSTRVLLDPHAWQHLCVSFDTTQSVEADRYYVALNGEDISSEMTGTKPPQNMTMKLLESGVVQTIGAYKDGAYSSYMDGYLSEFVVIDGVKLDATSFGEYDTNGVWRPVDVSGLTFGTNGFYLDFAASGDLGNDVSGNANDFTTSGSPTQSSDTPTNIHCVVTPLYLDDGALSEGNLTITPSGPNGASFGSIVIPETGVWGAKVTNINGCTSTALRVGVCSIDADKTANLSTTSGIYGVFYRDNGVVLIDGSSDTTGLDTFAASSEAVEIIVDRANDLVHFYTDGGDQGEYTIPSGHEGKPLVFATNWGATDANVTWDFGQGGYDPSGTHSGALALNSANLYTNAAPAIEDGTAHFQAITWSGDNNAPRSLTFSGNSALPPDFMWAKRRNSSKSHVLVDEVRGDDGTAMYSLESDSSGAELDSGTTGTAGYFSSLDANGFTLDVASTFSNLNDSGSTYVGWGWKGDGTSGSSNTAGSIPSTVNVNDTAGFSVVKYTSTDGSGAGTVGHGQTGALDLILVKNLDSADNWAVYHSGNTSAPETDYLILNLTNGTADSDTFWNDTAPSSTSPFVFSVGTSGAVNDQGAATNHIAYCFRSIPGYSAFGSYESNTSLDGPLILMDFKPAFFMCKSIDDAGDWLIFDAGREPYNEMQATLSANTDGDENTSTTVSDIDFLSNGVKLREDNIDLNSTGTYIWAAFAEHPFAGSSPATAR